MCYCCCVRSITIVGSLRSILCVLMAGHKVCSHSDCPTANTHRDYTTNCGRCGKILHLLCIGINRKVSDVLIHSNVKVYCNNCMKENTNTNAMPPPISSAATKQMAKALSSASTGTGQPVANVASSAKIDSIVDLLHKVHKVVSDTNAKVTSHVASSADTLNEVKELSVKTNAKLVEVNKNKPSFANVVSSKNKDFPPINVQTPKRRREEDSPLKKFVGRKLMAGTANVAEHGLGACVELNRQKRVSPSQYEHLSKSIYVSRLQTDVTAEMIMEFIKSKMPELNDNDVSLRMLVKKDAKLDELTFVSYRLACTESLYGKFFDPSFWPAHVMIGEFLENARRPAKVAAFANTPVAKVTDDHTNLHAIENKLISASKGSATKATVVETTRHRIVPNGKEHTATIVDLLD